MKEEERIAHALQKLEQREFHCVRRLASDRSVSKRASKQLVYVRNGGRDDHASRQANRSGTGTSKEDGRDTDGNGIRASAHDVATQRRGGGRREAPSGHLCTDQ